MFNLVFEDANDTPSSKLIRLAYAEDSVYFAGGSSAVNIILHRICNSQSVEPVLAYMDLALNNASSFRDVIATIAEICKDALPVYLVPIPCIEYYLLDTILSYYANESLIFRLNNCELESGCSIEKQYKSMLNRDLGSKSLCLVNRNKARSSHIGWWYYSDCPCSRYTEYPSGLSSCRLANLYDFMPLAVIDKGKRLKQAMPVSFDTASGLIHCCGDIVTSMYDVLKAQESYYFNACEKLGLAKDSVADIFDGLFDYSRILASRGVTFS